MPGWFYPTVCIACGLFTLAAVPGLILACREAFAPLPGRRLPERPRANRCPVATEREPPPDDSERKREGA